VSFGRDETVPNLVVVKVGDGGKVSLYNNSGQAHVIFDVQGWYGDQPAGDVGRYQALTPDRIVDTRDGTGGRDTKLGSGQTMDVQVTGRGGVPASDVSAVVMNVTATNPTAASFLTAYPAGATKPSASNLNFVAGQTVSNRVVAKIGTGGKVKLYNNSGATHVVIDVSGWFTDSSAAGDPGSFVPLVPQRVLDTRTGLGGYSTKVGAGRSIDVQMTGVGGVPDSGVSAVVFNLTTANGTRSTYLTAYPTGTSKPPSADLNPPAGHITSNLVMVKVGDGGEVTVYNNSGETDVIADVVGYYVAP
jgi:hypothetical protein